MLLNLSILDFVLVERLDLDFGPGFGVLTGETGAGKSILLDALQLVLGGRADASVVRDGRPRAEVSATFDAPPELMDWLTEQGLEGDGPECLLRRVVEVGGRSRAFINGRPATLGQLKEAGETLVDIHGQHAHYSLLKPAVQRQILDSYAGARALADEVAQAHRAWRHALQAHETAQSHAAESRLERERLQWQVDELAELGFSLEEWSDLQDSHRRLAHAAELIQGTRETVAQLEQEQQGAMAIMRQALHRTTDLARIDPGLTAPSDLLESALVQLQEVVRDLNHYVERVELDPEALAQAEQRMARINDMARKFRVRPEALPELLTEARAGLERLDKSTDLDFLASQAAVAGQAYQDAARKLSEQRRQAAVALEKSVTASMQALAMKGGAFGAALSALEHPDAGGLESVEFMVSPHGGQAMKPLAKTASGGELSRIGLALQAVLSKQAGAATLIFDEVDAGIGGAVAEVVGRLLAELGQRHQVLCVTHLPQVAARASRHYRVSKNSSAAGATSQVCELDTEARVEEVARMLGGMKITETTRNHAREMLAAPGA